MSWEDHVHLHSSLESLAPDLWWVQGTLPRMPLPRNMVVHRMADGRLWIHSPICMDEQGMAELEALGLPAILVVPNRFHRSDCARWKERFPDALVVCPVGARSHVAAVVAVDALASEAHRGTGVKAAVMPGCKDGELYYEVPVGDGEHALVVADLLFNLREHYGGIHGLILRYVTASTGFFGMTRVARFVNLKSVGPLRDFLLDMARRRDLSMIVVGHGPPVTDNVSEHFREAAGLL